MPGEAAGLWKHQEGKTAYTPAEGAGWMIMKREGRENGWMIECFAERWENLRPV
ncbi:hypothetical protein EP10_002051 [Geobacillus icigianus]|uniref:Uncharacterized protein n=1 Tax=Geobacillus icigianus TaxID=1430331 RepID=A0ABU6BH49_9BACL|nr:hypothetical protein [Geobacillus icigianus]